MEVEQVPLTELLSKVVDNRGRTCPTDVAGLPLIATNCIRNDLLYPAFEKVRYVSRETYETWFRGHPEPGDLIFVCKGTPGRVCMAPDPVSFCIAQDMVALRADPEKVYTRYLFAVLRLPGVQTKIANMHVGTLIPHFKKGDFDKLLLPIPGKRMQEAIGDIYFNFSAKIELNRRMNRTLEEMARAIFKSWFVDFDPVRAKGAVRREHPRWTNEQVSRAACPNLRPDLAALFPDTLEDSELGEIPKGWRGASIYEIADVIYGAPFASKQFNTDGDGKPLVRIRDLKEESPGVWTPEVHPKGYLVHPGDIVVGMDGEFRAYLWGGVEAWLNQRVCVFAPKPGFSAAFVRNSIIGPLAQVEATETATTVIHLGKNDIDRFSVVVPDAPVAEAFLRICQPWYDRIVGNKKETRTLAALRDALLPKLLSGELRVADAEGVVGRRV